MPVSRRRLLVIGGALAATPARAWPQPRARTRRVGIVSWSGSLMDRASPGGRDFLAAMKDLGYVEGRDFAYDERYWHSQDKAAELVRELVRLKAEVIIAAGPPSIAAARPVTTEVPIVMI